MCTCVLVYLYQLCVCFAAPTSTLCLHISGSLPLGGSCARSSVRSSLAFFSFFLSFRSFFFLSLLLFFFPLFFLSSFFLIFFFLVLSWLFFGKRTYEYELWIGSLALPHPLFVPVSFRSWSNVQTYVQNIRTNLGSWRTSFAESGGGAPPGARQLKSTAKEFLRRTLVFLEAPANSQPGM